MKENLESLSFKELAAGLKAVPSPDDNGTFVDYLRLIADGEPMASRIEMHHAQAILDIIVLFDSGKNTLSPMEREQFKQAIEAVGQEIQITRDNLHGVKLDLDPNRTDVPYEAIEEHKTHSELGREINPDYDPALSEKQRIENMELLQWLPIRIAKLDQSSALLDAMDRKLDLGTDNPVRSDVKNHPMVDNKDDKSKQKPSRRGVLFPWRKEKDTKQPGNAPSQASKEEFQQSDIVDLIVNGATHRRGFLKTISAWLLTPNISLQSVPVPEMSIEEAKRLIELLQDPAVLALPTMLNAPQCLAGLLVGAVKPGELKVFKEDLEGKVKMTDLDAILNNRSVDTAQNLLRYAKQIRQRLQTVHEKQAALFNYIEKKTGQTPYIEIDQLCHRDLDLRFFLEDECKEMMPRLQRVFHTAYDQNPNTDLMLERMAQDFSAAYKQGGLDEWVSRNFGAGHEDLVSRITNIKDYKRRHRNASEEKDFRIKELKTLLELPIVKIEINVALDGSMYKPTMNMAKITAPEDTLGIIQKTISRVFPEANMDRTEPMQGNSGAFDPIPSLSLREPPSELMNILSAKKKEQDIKWGKEVSKPTQRGYWA